MKVRRELFAALLTLVVGIAPAAVLAADAGRAMPEIGFSGLATLDLQVRDRAEALEWFSRVLGFEHLFTAEEINWAEVRSPVLKLTIGIEEIRDRPIRTTNFDFGVRDIAAARSALEQRGAVFVGEIVDYGPVLIARLRDPSGNMFNIFQGK